jgi:hypothetical protein
LNYFISKGCFYKSNNILISSCHLTGVRIGGLGTGWLDWRLPCVGSREIEESGAPPRALHHLASSVSSTAPEPTTGVYLPDTSSMAVAGPRDGGAAWRRRGRAPLSTPTRIRGGGLLAALVLLAATQMTGRPPLSCFLDSFRLDSIRLHLSCSDAEEQGPPSRRWRAGAGTRRLEEHRPTRVSSPAPSASLWSL